jgi:hypothetical protein
VLLYRLPSGRLLARRVDCKTKGCGKCGPRLRAEAARRWTAVMAGASVYRLVVADTDWSRCQRHLRKAEAAYGMLPAPGAVRVVYTPVARVGGYVGVLVTDLTSTLATDFAAMPTDRRHKRLHGRWLQLANELEQARHDAEAAPVGDFLGVLRRPLEHVAMIAQDLGLHDGEAGSSGLYLRDPPDAETWRRFCALARLYRPGADRDREGQHALGRRP